MGPITAALATATSMFIPAAVRRYRSARDPCDATSADTQDGRTPWPYLWSKLSALVSDAAASLRSCAICWVKSCVILLPSPCEENGGQGERDGDNEDQGQRVGDVIADAVFHVDVL